jgi:DNA-binding XRE family transcriptional regulator
MEIQDRIIYLINFKNLNKNSFSKLADINPQTIHHIVSGRRTHPSFEVLVKILKAFPDINCEWLLLGFGDPIKTVLVNENKPINDDQNNCLNNKCLEKVIDSQNSTIKFLSDLISDLLNEKNLLLNKLQ